MGGKFFYGVGYLFSSVFFTIIFRFSKHSKIKSINKFFIFFTVTHTI